MEMNRYEKRKMLIKMLFDRKYVENLLEGSFREINKEFVSSKLKLSMKDTFMETKKLKGKLIVDLDLLKKFFTYNGFQALEKLAKVKFPLMTGHVMSVKKKPPKIWFNSIAA